jgi:tRNA nucleotidyltransferase (CCA-adding enzyme)
MAAKVMGGAAEAAAAAAGPSSSPGRSESPRPPRSPRPPEARKSRKSSASPGSPRPPRLRPELAARVRAVARLAAERGVAAYLVGGTVRDLLLGRDSPDLDFVTIGDGLGLAAAVAGELGGRLLRHDDFLTADVIDAAGIHLDIATARRERYAAMAALPEVWPAAALDEDLRRRDFTVNAMALPLQAAGGRGPAGEDREDMEAGERGGAGEAGDLEATLAGGRWIDPCGGRRDLAARALRVLHDRSFLDDPTRLLRGVRFEVRLGFRLTRESEALARQAVAAGAFARLSGSRLRHELELLLEAEGGAEAALAGLERLQGLGVLGTLHSRLALDAEARRRLLAAAAEHDWYLANVAGAPPAAGAGVAVAAARAAGPAAAGAGRSAGTARVARGQGRPARRWLLMLLALAAGLTSEEERGELAARLLLAGDDQRLLTGFGRTLAAALPRLVRAALPHEVDAALAGLKDEELLLLAAMAPAPARAWVRRYLTELRPLALGIRGADLLAAGARRGPEVGHALRATREARLDGKIGAGEELGFALACLAPATAAATAGTAATAPHPEARRGARSKPRRGEPEAERE